MSCPLAAPRSAFRTCPAPRRQRRRVVPVVSPAAPPSFDAVYRAHAKTVSRWASRLLGPGGDCEDVVQEVFIVVRHKLPRFDGQAEITDLAVRDHRARRPGLAAAAAVVVVGDRARAEPEPRPPADAAVAPPARAHTIRWPDSRGASGCSSSIGFSTGSARRTARPSSCSSWRVSRASASPRSRARGWARSGSASPARGAPSSSGCASWKRKNDRATEQEGRP